MVVPADMKGIDKGDNHDSGIDVSDQPNSTPSSTRSSPSGDSKLITSSTVSSLPPTVSQDLPEVGVFFLPAHSCYKVKCFISLFEFKGMQFRILISII